MQFIGDFDVLNLELFIPKNPHPFSKSGLKIKETLKPPSFKKDCDNFQNIIKKMS
jgi:hypothetical protein